MGFGGGTAGFWDTGSGAMRFSWVIFNMNIDFVSNKDFFRVRGA